MDTHGSHGTSADAGSQKRLRDVEAGAPTSGQGVSPGHDEFEIGNAFKKRTPQHIHRHEDPETPSAPAGLTQPLEQKEAPSGSGHIPFVYHLSPQGGVATPGSPGSATYDSSTGIPLAEQRTPPSLDLEPTLEVTPTQIIPPSTTGAITVTTDVVVALLGVQHTVQAVQFQQTPIQGLVQLDASPAPLLIDAAPHQEAVAAPGPEHTLSFRQETPASLKVQFSVQAQVTAGQSDEDTPQAHAQHPPPPANSLPESSLQEQEQQQHVAVTPKAQTSVAGRPEYLAALDSVDRVSDSLKSGSRSGTQAAGAVKADALASAPAGTARVPLEAAAPVPAVALVSLPEPLHKAQHDTAAASPAAAAPPGQLPSVAPPSTETELRQATLQVVQLVTALLDQQEYEDEDVADLGHRDSWETAGLTPHATQQDGDVAGTVTDSTLGEVEAGARPLPTLLRPIGPLLSPPPLPSRDLTAWESRDTAGLLGKTDSLPDKLVGRTTEMGADAAAVGAGGPGDLAQLTAAVKRLKAAQAAAATARQATLVEQSSQMILQALDREGVSIRSHADEVQEAGHAWQQQLCQQLNDRFRACQDIVAHYESQLVQGWEEYRQLYNKMVDSKQSLEQRLLTELTPAVTQQIRNFRAAAEQHVQAVEAQMQSVEHKFGLSSFKRALLAALQAGDGEQRAELQA